MTAREALAEAVAFLQGMSSIVEPDRGSDIIAEQLAKRGFSVQPASAPTLHDLSPETLRRVRLTLGLTQIAVAAETGLMRRTISNAEDGTVRSQMATRRTIGDALVRLGAKLPE